MDERQELAELEELEALEALERQAAASAAPQPKPKGFLGTIKEGVESVLEPAATMVTGIGSSILGAAAAAPAAAYEVLSGQAGQGKNYPERVFQSVVEAGTYMPRSQGGKENLADFGKAFQESKIPMAPTITGGIASSVLPRLAQPAIQQAAPMGRKALQEIFDGYAAKREGALTQSRDDAPKFEAIRSADKFDIPIPEFYRDPSTVNKLRQAFVGADRIESAFTPVVQRRMEGVVKGELGLVRDAPLSVESLKAKRAEVGSPVYEEVKRVGMMQPDDTLIRQIQSLDNLEGMSPAAAEYMRAAAPKIIDEFSDLARNGFNGTDVVNFSRKYRKEANTIYGKQNPSIEEIALADAKKGISVALEDMVERNLATTNPKLMENFRAAREYIAKSHVIQNALDNNTGRVDFGKIADLTAKEGPLTGNLQQLGQIGGVFPELIKPSNVEATKMNRLVDHLSRSTLGGTAGLVAGTLLGDPLIGSVVGAAAAPLVRNRMASNMLSRATGEDIGLINRLKLQGGLVQQQAAALAGSPTERQMQMQQAIDAMYQGRTIPADLRGLRERMGYGRPVAPEPPLTLAPEGELLVTPSPQRPMPEGRGMLSLAEDAKVQKIAEVQGIPYDVAARLNPNQFDDLGNIRRTIYQGGEIEQPPVFKPEQFSLENLPPEQANLLTIIDESTGQPLPTIPGVAEFGGTRFIIKDGESGLIEVPPVTEPLQELNLGGGWVPRLDVPEQGLLQGAEEFNKSLADLVSDLQRSQETNPILSQKFKVQKSAPVKLRGKATGANLLDEGDVGAVEKTFDPRSKAPAPAAKGEMSGGLEIPLTIDRMGEIEGRLDILVKTIADQAKKIEAGKIEVSPDQIRRTMSEMDALLKSVNVRGKADLSIAKKLYGTKTATKIEKVLDARSKLKPKKLGDLLL